MSRPKDDPPQRNSTREQLHPLKKIARDLRSGISEDEAQSKGQRRPMEPLALLPTSAKLGNSVVHQILDQPVMRLAPSFRLVVCELHFAAPPAFLRKELNELLRQEYPLEGPIGTPHVAFLSPGGEWAARIASRGTVGVIGLETRHFEGFPEFHDRLFAIRGSLGRKVIIESFTRVGLRTVLAPAEQIESWEGSSLDRVVRRTIEGVRSSLRYKLHEDLDPVGKELPYRDVDVFAEDITATTLAVRLASIYQVNCQLATGEGSEPATTLRTERWRSAKARSRSAPSTEVVVYPDLLPPSEIDLLTDDLLQERTELLVRKYTSGKVSTNDRERLAALTERLDRLLPSVSVDQLEQLENISEQSQSIRARALKRKKRFGLT
ncbi:MAG TPA: hypothetical protein VFE33_17880 [Thermoanaerobaculia bacterium]|nr:hypothetical protein [Thermoanaerobaculia bacterium]